MNSNKKIRVVQWGLGAMGRGMAQLITTKEGLELVGAIDVTLLWTARTSVRCSASILST